MHSILEKYIQKYGIEQLSQPQRLCSFLDDALPRESVEKRVMKQGIRHGFLNQLLARQQAGVDLQQSVNHFISKAENELGLSNSWAVFLIEEMALALGWNISRQFGTPSAPVPQNSGYSAQQQVSQLQQPFQPVPPSGTFTYSNPLDLFMEWDNRKKNIPYLFELFMEVYCHVYRMYCHFSHQELQQIWRDMMYKTGFSKDDFIRCVMNDDSLFRYLSIDKPKIKSFLEKLL